MTPVRLEPAALRSRDKHSTTEPLPSQVNHMQLFIIGGFKIFHKLGSEDFKKFLVLKMSTVFRISAGLQSTHQGLLHY